MTALTFHDNRVRIMTFNGGAVKDLEIQGWSLLEKIAWSSDGASLFVDANRGSPELSGTRAVLHLDMNGRVHVLLEKPSQWFLRPLPSPDGRYLAFAAMIHESNAWILEGF